jgi:2-methylcitrate dehydratase PrpD
MKGTIDTSASEHLADWLAAVTDNALPRAVDKVVRRLVVDVVGLCVAARHQDYVAATLAAVDGGGPCTAIGHDGGFDAFGAALVNGTAAHGEDFDDTFELMCRLSLVAPMGAHKAGFHPTAVFGALAAAGGAGVAMGLERDALVSALGIAGSMASGIIEYLAEGTWTKRMHAGWAAQSGLRAALMARGGFKGPRTVLEGTHGFYKAFAPSVAPDFAPLLTDLGQRWVTEDLAFKPYACGTMTQPFIDCALALARSGIQADAIVAIECEVGEGTVHRLWEPLEVKHRPPTPYAAKFSTPYCMAVGFFDGRAGFAQFTDARIADATVLALAEKIRYRINPHDEYPRNFSGHLRATLRDGSTAEFRQPHMRGGAREPLGDAEVSAKFIGNAVHGGLSQEQAERLLRTTEGLLSGPSMAQASELRA